MRVLVFINDSLGELDWLAEFMKAESASDIMFYVYIYGPGRSVKEKNTIFDTYRFPNNCVLIGSSAFSIYSYWLDSNLNKVLNLSKRLGYRFFESSRWCVDWVRRLYGYLATRTFSETKFDFVFRDYNLKDSFTLAGFLSANSKAKIVIFPHAQQIQLRHSQCPRERLKKITADLWLENSRFSDYAVNEGYGDVFYASGSPDIASGYCRESLFDHTSKTVIILTRVCIPEYGFDLQSGLKTYRATLQCLEKQKYHVVVKHHPRDNKIEEWRQVEKDFNNVSVYQGPLSSLEQKFSLCIALYSTAPLSLIARGIPAVEISPYGLATDYNYKMPYHYANSHGELSHFFIDKQVFKRGSPASISKILESKDQLIQLSAAQLYALKCIFPKYANRKIERKLREMFHG